MAQSQSAPIVSRYTVKPFSQQYVEGVSYNGGEDGFERCGICCRKTRTDRRTWGVVINGGSDWGDESSNSSDPGYMGWFPIGPDCHRKYKVPSDG